MKKKIIYGIILLLFFVVLVFGVPIIINESYLKNDGYLTVWDGSDVFAYYASVLSFMGTVILGIVTVWQNRRAIEINDKLLNLETKHKRGYFIPQHKIKNPNTGLNYCFGNR